MNVILILLLGTISIQNVKVVNGNICRVKHGKIFNNKCYFVPENIYASQCGCQYYCSRKGGNGTLACVESKEHFEWLSKHFKASFSKTGGAWIGLYKSKATTKIDEKTYNHHLKWVNQQCGNVNTTFVDGFHEGEPNNYGGNFEPCVMYTNAYGKSRWIDIQCRAAVPCICEQDAIPAEAYINSVDHGKKHDGEKDDIKHLDCTFDDRDPFQSGTDGQLIATLFFLTFITALNFFFCLPLRKKAATTIPDEENEIDNAEVVTPRKIDTDALNGLRGIVAIHIAIGHYSGFGLGVDLLGGTSLSLFYLLSGYIMTIGYASKLINPNERQRDNAKMLNKKRFMVNRVARLCPLYWCTNICSCFCAVFIIILVTGALAPADCDYGAQSCMDPLANFFMSLSMLNVWVRPFNLWIPRGDRVVYPSNGVTWTVQTMFLFYVAFPYVIPWLASLQKRIRNLSVAIEILFYMQLVIFFSIVDFGILYLNNFDFAYWTARSFPPSRLPVFMMGCVLALRSLYGNENDSVRIYFTCCCKTSMKRMKRYQPSDNTATNLESSTPENLIAAAAADRLSAALLLTLLIAIIICATTKIVDFVVFRVIFEPIFPLFFAQLMVDLTNAGKMNGIVNKICRSKLGQFIGRISMSLYLLHMMIFTACAGLIYHAPIIILVLIFAFAVLIAYGVTVYIEDPCRRCIRADSKNQIGASQQQHVGTNNAGLNGVQMTVVQPIHHNHQQQQQQLSQVLYPVTIPDGVSPGMQMQVQLTNGQTRLIIVPQGAAPGTVINII